LQVAERNGRKAAFGPLGFVAGPSQRRLRIAYSTRDLMGLEPEPEVKAATDAVARLCEDLGHTVEEVAPPFEGEEAVQHFVAYWAAGPAKLVRYFWLLRLKTLYRYRLADAFEPWTMGLAEWFNTGESQRPGLVRRAQSFFQMVDRLFADFFTLYDVHLTPVMRKRPARLGEYAPTVPFKDLLDGCVAQITYTPLHNAIGTPAMSVPLSMSSDGLPIGSQFATRAGDERTLLELAYELEEALPWAGRWPAMSGGNALPHPSAGA
jgi:amidase